MMPITGSGSTVHWRLAYKARPAFVFRRWRMASTAVVVGKIDLVLANRSNWSMTSTT